MATSLTQDRYHATGNTFAAALRRVALCLKFAEDQPRIPAGNPNGGQWTSGGDGAASPVDLIGSFLSNLPTVLLAGGFDKEDMGKTVQEFVSEKCRGSIYEVLPGQFLEWTIQELVAANKSHGRAAQRCFKLLREDRFRK